MPKLFELKRVRAAGVLVCGALLAIVPALARQNAPPPPSQQGDMEGPPPGGPGGGRGGMNPERRVEMMQRQLNLTPDQVTAIKGVFAEEHARMEAARASGEQTPPEDRHAKMMAMHEEENAKIKAVLTPEQKTKYEAMEARMRERAQERRSGGDGAAPPPPPQQ